MRKIKPFVVSIASFRAQLFTNLDITVLVSKLVRCGGD